MPTLHLIDGDSTQACPTVYRAIRAMMAASNNPVDHLLILGSRAHFSIALQAGIKPDQASCLSVPFSKAVLGLLPLRRWIAERPTFTKTQCWSPGAFIAATRLCKKTPRRLNLVHTPNHRWIKQLSRLSNVNKYPDTLITTDTPALAQHLQNLGINCEAKLIALSVAHDSPLSDEKRTELRASWGVTKSTERVVVLLSDHPALADAIDAAEVAVLGCATLTDKLNQPVRVTLLIHPLQLHRRRAQTFIEKQPIDLKLLQEQRISSPWLLLDACDAVLALGQDAGGLSLRHALQHNKPIITPQSGPATTLDHADKNLHLAPSPQTKDLAHQLRLALME